MAGAHARCSASSAKRWIACPGSLQGPPVENKSSIHSATGTFAHDIAAKCLDENVSPADFLLHRAKVDGFDVMCDQEMVEAVELYVDDIRADLQDGDMRWTEMPLLEPLSGIDPDLGGTADFVRYRPSAESLRVVDFKFGAGVYVDAEDNDQAKVYALGALLKVGLPVKEIEVVIIQPRYEGAAPVRTWVFPTSEVLDFVADIQDAAAASRQPNAPLVAGDHCKFCPRARECPELEKKHHAIVSAQFDVAIPTDMKLVGDLLAAIPLVKERIKAIEEYAYAQAMKGVDVPGHKLVDKVARRQWKSPDVVELWAKGAGVDPYGERPLLSPAQIEAKLKEAAPKGKKKDAGAVLEPLVEKVSAGTVLVPVSDSRPPVKMITAEAFEVSTEAA